MKTVDMIADMLNLQANYDDIVCKTQGIDLYKINYEDFISALMDELGELNHELKSRWCWWKKTQEPENRDKVLEELVDVWHFVLMGTLMKCSHDPERANGFLRGVETAVERFEEFKETAIENAIPANFMFQYIMADSFQIGVVIMYLSYHCGFTLEEVYEAYKAKNKINIERQRTGY